MIVEKPNSRYRIDVLPVIPESVYSELPSLQGLTLYHTAPWHRVLEKTFGWEVHAMTIRDQDEELLWFLPFVRKRRLGFSRVNVCLPLSNRIGPAYRQEIDWDGQQVPDEMWPIEIHEQVNIPQQLHQVQHHTTTLHLSRFQSLEALRRSFKTNVQRNIKKAEKNGINSAKASDEGQFAAFTELQTETRQRQGSPTYPKAFFHNMREEFEAHDAVHLHVAYADGRPVCGVLFLHFRETAIYGYGASRSDPAVWRTGANQLAMWSAIREAFEKNLSRVEFGTSPISQPELKTYKEGWNGESTELPYTYAGSRSTGQINRTSASAKAVSWALQRLPRPVFSAISPLIMRAVV